MRLDIHDPLKRESSSPENGDVSAERARQSASTRQFAGEENADQAKGDNCQDDIGAINPVHLPMQTGEAGEFGFPMKLRRYLQGSNQYSQLSESGQKDQRFKQFLHSAPSSTLVNRPAQ